jgi:SAM-dependent methyltransferase
VNFGHEPSRGFHDRLTRERAIPKNAPGPHEQSHNPNRSLIRIFCLSLSGLLLVYSSIAVYGLFTLESIDATELATGLLRIALGLIALGVLLRWGWVAEPLQHQVGRMGATFEADYANLSRKTKIRSIVLVTMLSLLLELVMIRWLASVFPVFSFYKNFTMLACFLGLGAGYAVAERQPCAPAMVLPMLALFVAHAVALREHLRPAGLLSAGGQLHRLRLHLLSGRPALRQTAAQFGFEQSLWIQPGGQHYRGHRPVRDEPVLAAAGDLVRRHRRHYAAVRAVARRIPPRRDRKLLRAAGDPGLAGAAGDAANLFAVPAAGANRQGGRADADPVRRKLLPEGLQFHGQQGGHEPDADGYVRAYYEFPYNFKKAPERVAIVGSGSGNDVATALRMGAAHVDAIEIDPAIAFLGAKYHPERPYDDPRVTLSINDARNFFRTASQQYDLIVYGVLDSHTALSHASNLRVDSYVYTREGIAEAFRLLKPDGVLSISFTLVNDALGFKLSKILRDLPGAGRPLAVRVLYDNSRTTAFIARRGQGATMPDAKAFASIGFTDVSDYFAQPFRPTIGRSSTWSSAPIPSPT